MEPLICIEHPQGLGIVVPVGLFGTSNKKECLMKPKRIVMGAAVVGCFAAAMISGVSAQERGNISGHVNARAGGSHVEATGQLNRVPRQGGGHYTNASRMGEASVRREFAEGRAVGGEKRFARVGSEARYGWRGDRWAYRDRSVGVGVAADGDSYGRRPLTLTRPWARITTTSPAMTSPTARFRITTTRPAMTSPTMRFRTTTTRPESASASVSAQLASASALLGDGGS